MSFILSWVDVCACQDGGTCMFCVFARMCVGMCRRTGGEGVRWTRLCWMYRCVSALPSSRSFPFMPSAWITLCNALCQVDGGGRRGQLPFETCYYYHQRGGSPPSPALILISTETEGESGSFVSEMFIYATDLPKDMEKPLLQVMTVDPQHVIHFLSFNLVVSMGKSSPHPAVKHGHYSIMRELYLKQFWDCRL